MGTKISELTACDALDGTEAVAVVQDGTTRKALAAEIGGGPFANVGSSGALQYGRGVTSTAKDSTGNYTVTLATAYTLGTIFPIAICYGSSAKFATIEVAGTTTITVHTFDAAGAAADAEFFIWFVGL